MKPFSIEKQLTTLDEYERELLDSIENEEWISIYETSEQFESGKNELMKAARNSLNIPKDIKGILFETDSTHCPNQDSQDFQDCHD